MGTAVNRFRFGVNYTPTQNWYYCWNDFDADAIRRDVDTVAGGCMRITSACN